MIIKLVRLLHNSGLLSHSKIEIATSFNSLSATGLRVNGEVVIVINSRMVEHGSGGAIAGYKVAISQQDGVRVGVAIDDYAVLIWYFLNRYLRAYPLCRLQAALHFSALFLLACPLSSFSWRVLFGAFRIDSWVGPI